MLLSPVSSTNKSDRHDITEKMLKAALNKQAKKQKTHTHANTEN
jgi:hypothetical protein